MRGRLVSRWPEAAGEGGVPAMGAGGVGARREGSSMAVAVLWEATGTWEQYEESLIKLEEAGWGSPDARLYHVAGPTEGGFRGVDIWESAETYEEFGKVLGSMVDQIGIALTDLRMWPVQNIVKP